MLALLRVEAIQTNSLCAVGKTDPTKHLNAFRCSFPVEIMKIISTHLQGDRANGMYFVESGTLVVLKKMGGDAGDEKAVNEV